MMVCCLAFLALSLLKSITGFDVVVVGGEGRCCSCCSGNGWEFEEEGIDGGDGEEGGEGGEDGEGGG